MLYVAGYLWLIYYGCMANTPEQIDRLPLCFKGPQAWFGKEKAEQCDSWIYEWNAAEIAEIEMAVASVGTLDIMDITAGDFALPTVAERLAKIKQQVLHGPGFFLLRGLPVEDWPIGKAAIAYWGLGVHMGRACSQNGKGHVLGHVKNIGLNYDDPQARGYQTNAGLSYHTDSADIVGLLCLQPGKVGGLSSITPSTTLYNETLRRRPDLLASLMAPFQRTRWGEIPEGKHPWADVPVFMPYKGRMIAHYVRSAIRKGQLLAGVAPLTDTRLEALDFLDVLAAEDGIRLDMEFRTGDIQFLCNHAIFHSRTAYEDYEELERRRHLLRLWLACTDGPPLPHWMTDAYEGKIADGRPNGFEVPGVALNAPLEAK